MTAGIERMLRMVQAILMVVLSQPVLTSGFFKLIALGNQHIWTEPRIASTVALSKLRGHVGLVRRFFRMFRFLESFRTAHAIYTSFYAPLLPPPPIPPSAPCPEPATESEALSGGTNTKAAEDQRAEPPPPAQAHTHAHHHRPRNPAKPPTEAWLDIFSRTFNGMYLLLETLTLLDALQLPGLSLWDPSWFSILHVEGQRFWFLALACGVLSGLIKFVKLVAWAPVPQTGEGYGTPLDTKDLPEWKKQREKMRRLVYARRETRRVWKEQIRTRGYGLARRCVADILDLAAPGSVLGWVGVESGTVGAVMVISTWITGREVWERCGMEIGRV